jgi:hypothetical protein
VTTRAQQQAQRAKERAEAKAAEARRQRTMRITVAAVLVAVAGAFVALAVLTGGDDKQAGSTDAAGLRTSAPPWPPLTDGLNERIGSLGFPPVGDESYHAHVLLSVYRDAKKVTVPENMGFGADGSHSSLHTHTPDGVIHMEADDPYPYELGHVFTTWGVAFGADRLGGDVASGSKKVHVYVNGQPAPPGPVVLKDKDNVVVAYGEDGSFPKLPDASALENA